MRASSSISLGIVALAAMSFHRSAGDMADELLRLITLHDASNIAAVIVEPMSGQVPFTAETLAQDGVKLVNFWASWCAPCRVEHPNLELLAGEGLPIYGINYKDDAQKAQGFLDELGSPYTALGADPKGKMALEWGVYGVPETFVVDGEGKVLARFAGPLTQRVIAERLRPVLEAAAKTTAP